MGLVGLGLPTSCLAVHVLASHKPETVSFRTLGLTFVVAILFNKEHYKNLGLGKDEVFPENIVLNKQA